MIAVYVKDGSAGASGVAAETEGGAARRPKEGHKYVYLPYSDRGSISH